MVLDLTLLRGRALGEGLGRKLHAAGALLAIPWCRLPVLVFGPEAEPREHRPVLIEQPQSQSQSQSQFRHNETESTPNQLETWAGVMQTTSSGTVVPPSGGGEGRAKKGKGGGGMIKIMSTS